MQPALEWAAELGALWLGGTAFVVARYCMSGRFVWSLVSCCFLLVLDITPAWLLVMVSPEMHLCFALPFASSVFVPAARIVSLREYTAPSAHESHELLCACVALMRKAQQASVDDREGMAVLTS
ncbi:hypothetical protein M011DRAFT_467418 [Sporormia fimetaria CBS 119925]|uniref:Uncharacterized protein n=1 Tax=Sporormia fimetaria CBS 119925 TaxID=1340428 RepID=A0A6A6VB97_9PLEO|nr:hypothetical protein M011DRAFT_467418 [Sporormia fimetaria CBS 119925]